jgi:hypothetical protein
MYMISSVRRPCCLFGTLITILVVLRGPTTRAQELYVLGEMTTPNQTLVHNYSYDGSLSRVDTIPGRGFTGISFDDPDDPRFAFLSRGAPSSTLFRHSLDDGTAELILTGFVSNSIAVNPLQRRIFFGVSSGAILSTNYDGTDVREVYPVPSGVQSITAMAIDPAGGWLYWAASRDIRRMSLAGGPVELIVGPTSPGVRPYFPYDIALDPTGGHLYWSEWDVQQQGEAEVQTSGRIVRSNLDGSDPQVVLQDHGFDDIPGVPEIGINPKAIAIDPVAGILFAYDYQNGHLVKYCLDGSCYDDDFEMPNLSYNPIDMAVIPAVPEPSTLVLAGTAVIAIFGAGQVRRIRLRKRACSRK